MPEKDRLIYAAKLRLEQHLDNVFPVWATARHEDAKQQAMAVENLWLAWHALDLFMRSEAKNGCDNINQAV